MTFVDRLMANSLEMYSQLRIIADHLNDFIDDPEDFRVPDLRATYALLKRIDNDDNDQDQEG